MFWVEGATYIYWPIDNFARVEFVGVLWVEGATYIYRPIDDFARVEFVKVF
jgi:hypothetical protein